MVNTVNLAPVNLTRDCEARTIASSGKTVLNFSVAYNQWKGAGEPTEAHFFDVEYWPNENSLGRWMEFFRKGARCAIEGTLRQDRWQDRETGQTRSRVKIVARSIVMMGGGQQAQQYGATATSVVDAFAGTAYQVEGSEDAPF